MNYKLSGTGWLPGSRPGPKGRYDCILLIIEYSRIYQIRKYRSTKEYYISKNDGGPDLFGPYGSADAAEVALKFMESIE
jgi:hypothetical protein